MSVTRILDRSKFVTQIVHDPVVDSQGKSRVEIDTIQGLGDFFWAYQKLAPHFDVIDVNILVFNFTLVQVRTIDWLPLFPKVARCSAKQVTKQEYLDLFNAKMDLQPLLDKYAAGVKSHKYVVNKWLEHGTRIEEIDNLGVESPVYLKSSDIELPFSEYMILYVSGDTRYSRIPCWSIDQWLTFLTELYKKYKIATPIVIPGAAFDADVISELSERIENELNVPTCLFVGQKPEHVVHLIKNAKCLFGYQSGLHVLADNFDVPTLKINFDYLEPMIYSWCKKENIGKTFYADVFKTPPTQVVAKFDFSHFLN